MFKKAKQKIHNASVQVALSTAISPIPIVDMVLIVCRSTMLTRDIATIYGYRPGVFNYIAFKAECCECTFCWQDLDME